jgi:hypothetical protein
MMTNNETTNGKSRFSVIFAVLRFILETIFPSILILRERSYTSKAIFSKDEWVAKQLRQSSKVAMIFLIPSVFALYGTKIVYDEMQISSRLIEKPMAFIKKKEVKKAWKALYQGPSDSHVRDALSQMALLLLIPTLISVYIRTRSKILVQTKKLHKTLKENGFGRDGKIPMAVYLPIGIVIDVSGHDPKELVHNKSIWYALNIQVDEKEWIEDPNRRSIVLFKRSFSLASEYIYE